MEALRAKGYIVEHWWEDSILQTGDLVLDSLIIKARTCDGGIFIFGKDDQLKLTKTKKEYVPNVNVILESGMFFSSKGKSHTFIIKDGNYHEIKLPSDINGKLLPDFSDNNLITGIDTFFKKAKSEEQYEKFTFYFNKISIQAIIDKKYNEWGTKSLYVGSESARKWKTIESDPHYLQSRLIVPQFVKEIQQNTSIDIDFNKIDNVISLGPGCGIFDNAIVSEVFSVNPRISYIPIDINPHLAFEASNHINEKNPHLRIPFAIIDDFESNYTYVGDIIQRKFNKFRQVNLFVMLGGTFSNLEGKESDIVQKLISWMDSNDYLIIDTFIKKDNYSFKKDKNLHVNNLPASYKDLMTNACIKKYLALSTGKTQNAEFKFIKEITADLSKYLSEKEEKAQTKTNYTELSNTSVATYNLKLTGDKKVKEILIAKRYKYEEIENFLKSKFKLLHCFNGLLATTDNKSRGLFLLQKK